MQHSKDEGRSSPRWDAETVRVVEFVGVLLGTWVGWHRARSLVRYRSIAVIAIRALARTQRSITDKSDTFRQFAVTLDNYSVLNSLRPVRTPPGIVLLDEGIAQNAFKLFANSPRETAATDRELTAFAERAPAPDLLIYLRAEPATCVERLRSRRPIGLPRRFLDLEPDAVEPAFNAGRTCSTAWSRGCAGADARCSRSPRTIHLSSSRRCGRTHRSASSGWRRRHP